MKRENYIMIAQKKNQKCQGEIFLLPDHALTDGSISL